jgi:hypothetical protein
MRGYGGKMKNLDSHTVKKIIEYIDKRFDDPKHGCSFWAKLDGTTQTEDVGYAWEWWDDCMRSELEQLVEKDAK